jgi:hypothetical protein
MRAICLRAIKMPGIESSTGSTKHADNCPPGVPAFIRVGEFGRNRRSSIIRKNCSSLQGFTAAATRRKIPDVFSPGRR